jgi:hypothetical protein
MIAQEESFDLGVPVQPPILVCERDGLTEKTRCAELHIGATFIRSLPWLCTPSGRRNI